MSAKMSCVFYSALRFAALISTLGVSFFSCKDNKGKREIVEKNVGSSEDNRPQSAADTQQNVPVAASGSLGTTASLDALAKLFEGKLVEVFSNSGIVVRMNYAGNKIFCTPKTGGEPTCLIQEPLYKNNRCFIRKEIKDKLQTAALLLQKQKPAFKIVLLDCYRPISVQKRMFEKVGNPIWVAAPTPPRYGGHNRGIAVDVTLQDAAGKELDMGSLFDEFSSRSMYNAVVSASHAANRKLLRDVFVGAGLKPYDNEWWHFSLDIDAIPHDIPL